MTFEEWVKSRQDARQWSEDELACAEIAWKCATKISQEALYGTFICPKCGVVSGNNDRRNDSVGVA
jgi:predicted RNA-binding Zn-ribbon protein involved in translation (DUF1610 family)